MFPLSWLWGRGKRRRRTGERGAHRLNTELQVRLGIRRLEDRRVLDASAAFWTATGQLEVQLAGSGDQVAVQSDQGQLVLTDQQNQPISISVDGGAAGPVAVDDVQSLLVRGTADDQQGVALLTDLQAPGGLRIDDSVEFTILAADLDGGELLFGSPLQLASSARLSGDRIEFASSVDSQVNSVQDLVLDARTGGITFRGDLGGTTPLGKLTVLDSAAAVRFGDLTDVGAARTVRSTRGIELGRLNALGGIEFTGGPDVTWTISTTGDDVRLHGPVTVRGELTITTGSDRPGDILFTGAATLDSAVGEPGGGRVLLDAGTGKVAFHADLGTAVELGSLTVLRAEGGLFFGAAEAFPGETGTVGRIVAADGIELSTGTGEWGGPGIVFHGGEQGTTIQTRAADIAFHDSVTLVSDLTFQTDGGHVRFSSHSPIDSRLLLPSDQPRALTFALGTGQLFFNEDLGGAGSLSSLRILSASGVWFGEATAELPPDSTPLPGLPPGWLPMGRGPVEQIRTVGPIDLGVDQRIVGSGIVFIGGATTGTTIRTSQGDVRFHGPVELANPLRIASTSGDVRFTRESTVDSRTGRVAGLNVELESGTLLLNADIGSVRPLEHLTVSQAGGGVIVGESPQGTGTDAGPVQLIRTLQGIDFGRLVPIGGLGLQLQGPEAGALLIESLEGDLRFAAPTLLRSDVRFSTANGGGSILLTSDATVDVADQSYAWSVDAGAGRLALQGHVGVQSHPDSLVSPGSITLQAASGIMLGQMGGWNLVADEVRFASPVSLQSAVEIDANLIRFAASVDSRPGELHRLTVSTVEFLAPVGSLQPLGTLHVDGQQTQLRAHQSLHVERLQVDDASVELLGPVSTFSADQPGLVLQGSEMLFHDLTTTGEGSVRIESQAELRFAGTWQLSGSLMAKTSGPLTFTSATVQTAGMPIELIADVIQLSGDVRWSTADDSNVRGANVHVDGVIRPEGELLRPFELHVAAGSLADIHFEQPIEGTGDDDQLQIESAGDVNFSAAIQLGRIEQSRGTGTTRFAAPLRTSSSDRSGIELTTANLLFAAPVTAAGQGDVRLNISERLTIEPGATFQVAGSWQQTGGGQVDLGASVTAESGAIHFADSVRLLRDVTLRADGAAGEIIWGGPVDGNGAGGQTLTLSAAFGDILFLDAVGKSASLGELKILQVRDLGFAAAVQADSFHQVTGTGTTRFQGPQTLYGNQGSRIQTSTILLQDRLQLTAAAAPMTWRADREVAIEAPLVTSAGVVDIVTTGHVRLSSAGAIYSTGGSIWIETQNSSPVQPAGGLLMRDGAIIDSGSGRIDLRIEKDVQLGQLITTTQLDLRSSQGAIIDGGDLHPDLVAKSVRLYARFGIGTDNPLDTDIQLLAAHNEGPGGLRLENRRASGDRSLQITTLDGISGLTSGPLNSASADNRGGEIEIINLGRLEVAAPVQNHAGDHVRLRAEQAYLSNRVMFATEDSTEASGTGLSSSDTLVTSRSSSAFTVGALQGDQSAPVALLNSASGQVTVERRDVVDPTLLTADSPLRQGESLAILPADLVLRQPVQNRGGSGWIFLFAAQDLRIEDSLPEFLATDPARPFPEAEISVVGEGAIRGQAGGDLHVAAGDTNYVILRTHAERFANPSTVPPLPERFRDPAAFPALEDDPDFYLELEQALTAIRESVSPQFTNFAPKLEILSIDQGGSNVDEKGRVILEIRLGDLRHIERNFAVTVDWGDGTIENYTVPGQPEASRNFILNSGTRTNRRPDGTITGILVSGEYPLEQAHEPLADPGVYYLHHTYVEAPKPDDPSLPIPIRVELRYDARAEGNTALDNGLPPAGSGVFHGIRFFRNMSEEVFTSVDGIMTNPGQGAFQFIKVVKNEIVPVERRENVPLALTTTTVTSIDNSRSEAELVTTRVEDERAQGYRLFFVLVDDVRNQELPERYEVPFDALADPVQLFTRRYRFPNGHYRLYLEDLKTRRDRLILDIHIYEGRAVPPDFRENAAEGQPAPSSSSETPLNDNPPAAPLPETGQNNATSLNDSPTPALPTSSGSSLPTRIKPTPVQPPASNSSE